MAKARDYRAEYARRAAAGTNKPKKKRQKRTPKKRDYKAEYARRVAKAKKRKESLSIARGHPLPHEVGRAELRQLARIARLPSPGQGGNRTESSKRQWARERVAEMAGVSTQLPDTKGETRARAPAWVSSGRSPDAEEFARWFVRLGLGSPQEAFTLWFSP